MSADAPGRPLADPAGERRADAASRRGPVTGRRPDFFIVGHEKCGTTALYNILRQHPQIFMPDLKEPRFFVGDPAARPQPPAGAAPALPRTLEEYLALFAPAADDQLAGEASPQYLRQPAAAARIAELQPGARIIAIVREPVSFLRSYHLHNLRERIETERSLRKALALEAERREGRRIPRRAHGRGRLMYAEAVRYVEQLERFEHALGAERVLVLIYEDFRADNAAAVGAVLRFLGVSDDLEFSPSEVRRERKAVRVRSAHRLALALRRARRQPERSGRLMRAVDAVTPRALRGQGFEDAMRRLVFAPAGPLDDDLTTELRLRFKAEVVALSAHLGRDLVAEWGYEDVV